MTNKDRLIAGGKMLGLFLWGMAVIMTCAAVWNTFPPATIGIAAGVTILTSGWNIYKAGKKVADDLK